MIKFMKFILRSKKSMLNQIAGTVKGRAKAGEAGQLASKAQILGAQKLNSPYSQPKQLCATSSNTPEIIAIRK